MASPWGVCHSDPPKGEPPTQPLLPPGPLGTQLLLLLFQLSPHVLEEPVITKDMYEVAVSLIQTFDDMDMRESG